MTINLAKGQKIDLTKSDGSSLTSFSVGLNWGAIEHGGFFGFGASVEAVDLDASAICFDKDNHPLDTIYYGQLDSRLARGFIHHTGDDRTGDVGGDDGEDNETIIVDLTKAPANVDKIAFVLVSFQAHDFSIVPHAGLRLYEGTPEAVGQVVATFNISKEARYAGHVAMIMGYLYRRNDKWKFESMGDATTDRTLGEVRNSVQRILASR